eukprot:TRINITY_DN5991_c0_g1_i2.p1 TRINITY_DN5991_c0_g1~~TRINITY_DN5991_c0_g1_i2.p1  ORF type:complete len:309 (-),score=64.00 TRINITY_DN5991_c0_g1_i2:62-988(-)
MHKLHCCDKPRATPPASFLLSAALLMGAGQYVLTCCAGARPDKTFQPACSCQAFKDTGRCRHLTAFELASTAPEDLAPRGGASCSCQEFRSSGSTCRHLQPRPPLTLSKQTGGTGETLDIQAKKVAAKRLVTVDDDKVDWYMREDKVVPANAGQRCGVFLDVDGVLHPLGIGAGDEDSFCRLPLLQQILAATGAGVVLSSSWRLDREGIQEVNDRMRETGLKELVDLTPAPKAPLNEIGNRDIDIQKWVAKHAEEVGWGERWLTLDDLDLTASLGEAHVVTTDGEVGLTPAKASEAIEKLRKLCQNHP